MTKTNTNYIKSVNRHNTDINRDSQTRFKYLTYFKGDTHYILNSIETSQGGSNTDRGSKRGVQCTNTTILYLAFIIRNLFKFS